MLVVTAALSVSEQIKDVGAYAGLASILGLAVLSLLYFGQARELKRLRDWAGRAPERTVELQQEADAAAAAAAKGRPAAPPAAAAARPAAAVPATAAGAAVRPAGSVAPGQAVTAAGTPRPGLPGAVPATAAGAAGVAGAVAASGGSVAPPGPAAPATGTPAPANGGSAVAPGGQETQALPAVTPDGPASGVPGAPASPPLPATAVPSVAAPTPMGPSPSPTGDHPVPLRQVSPGGPAAPRPRTAAGAGAAAVPPDEPEQAGRPRGRMLAIVGGVLAAAVIAVVLVTQLGGGDGDGTAAQSTPSSTDNTFVDPASGTSGPSATPAVDPGDYSVWVLNGTTQNGIAVQVAGKLEQDGFPTSGTGNAASSTEPTTEVFFAEGQKAGASAVAKELGVKAAEVKRVIPEVSVLLDGAPADVIVRLGADKATQ